MRIFPPEITFSAAIYRLPTTAGQKQAYPAAPSWTIEGAMVPFDRKSHALEGGQYTDPHELYVEGTADIRVGDKVTVDSVTYYVRKVFPANFGGMPHKRCSLSREI